MSIASRSVVHRKGTDAKEISNTTAGIPLLVQLGGCGWLMATGT